MIGATGLGPNRTAARSLLAGVCLAVGLTACGEQPRDEAEDLPDDGGAALDEPAASVALLAFPSEFTDRVQVDLTPMVAGAEEATARPTGNEEGEHVAVIARGRDGSLVGHHTTDPVQVGGGVTEAGIAAIDGLLPGGQSALALKWSEGCGSGCGRWTLRGSRGMTPWCAYSNPARRSNT